MTLLIDADFIVYKSCAACETEVDFGDDVILVTSRFSEALDLCERELYKIADDLGVYDNSILFFSDSKNFRKEIDPDYKGHRNRKKPNGYRRVINALKESFPVLIMPNLEADDAIGIYASSDKHRGFSIICSPDKDMRQIPGELYDLTNPVVEITEEEGRRWHLIQTMAGDQTDGYAGVPGIGVKKAEALLDTHGANWNTVVKAFAEKDLDESVALKNARLAKILQVNDYDFTTEQPRLWTPSPDCRADDGTEV